MSSLAATFRRYERSWLRGDLLAGVTVAAYLIPQVMAYAVVAGLHPFAGLWAALPALVIYAVLGSSASLSMGPESTTALMTAIAIGPLAAGQSTRYAVLAAALALLVGAMSLAAWLLRLGFVADLLSRPVLVGYLAGVALIMIAAQLGRVTGVPVSGRSFAEQVLSFCRGLGQIQPATIAVAGSVLAFLFVVRWRWPRLPGPLLAILLATAAVAALGLGSHGVSVIGPVPAGLPVPKLPAIHLTALHVLLLPAFSVLIVAFSDDVLTARSFARRREEIRPNRELLALGLANTGSGLVQGFPVSSSASRTAIAVAAGSRTQLYSVVAAATVVGVLEFLRPLLAHFPTAALGAIVIYAAIRLIDVDAFRRLFAFRRSELVIALCACAGVLAFNILYGVLLAIGLSVADLLLRVARPHDAILGRVPGLAGMHNIDDYPSARTIPGLVVYRYDAPLFFANAEDFRHRALAAAKLHPGRIRWFVLNAEANVEVDFTALQALDAVREELVSGGAVFALARVKQDLLARLEAFGLAEKIGPEHLYPTLPTAVEAYEKWVSQQDGEPAGGQ
ncbi:MAG: SulP family inorganic anion transporter [Streptosporangiaceae bacterium]|nr:sodium-independent anion transporter [Actinomycetota bacterium]